MSVKNTDKIPTLYRRDTDTRFPRHINALTPIRVQPRRHSGNSVVSLISSITNDADTSPIGTFATSLWYSRS